MGYAALFVLAAFLLVFSGCAQEEESQYIVTDDGETYGEFETEESQTVIGAIVQEWRAFSFVFLMISIGLIALAYPVSSALAMPDLKAWADVELGEAVSTVLVVAFVMGVLVFAELTTHLLTGDPSFGLGCDVGSERFCPITIAEKYLQEYLDKSFAIYEDILEDAVHAGKLATMSWVVGTNYLFLGYMSISFKTFPHFMIDVTTASQQMQFLMGMRDALIFQQFILNHVSATLAPMSLMLGIIFRSFFVTRKMGGLMMAFGIGFLLVYPAAYALAMFTLNTTLYGTTTTGGNVDTQFCTASCRQLSPVAYKTSGGTETYTRSGLTELFPQESDETDANYTNRIDNLIFGMECEPDDWEDCSKVEKTTSPETGQTIYFCGYYNDVCPYACRTLPYPNQNPECARRHTEYHCRETVPEECFLIRYASLDDPALGGLVEDDEEGQVPPDYCPRKCRPLVGLKKEGCGGMVGYGFEFLKGVEVEEHEVADVELSIVLDEYGYGLYDRCEDRWGEWIADIYCESDDDALRVLGWMGYEELERSTSVAWMEGCPNHCRWVDTDGELGNGCDPDFCGSRPSDPEGLWDDAYDAADPDDYDLDAQIDAAEESCYMVIPRSVFTDKDCIDCTYLMDPGFASYPPVHQRCDNLCGKAKKVAVSSDSAAMESAIDGFAGPLATKQITKLVVPAIVLPMLNLVITFMFIRSLSPILGGDIDIPGMMGMIR